MNKRLSDKSSKRHRLRSIPVGRRLKRRRELNLWRDATHISLNGNDWLFKDFYGEDWRWRNSHCPGSRDTRGWRTGSVPGCPHHDLWKLGEIPNPYIERYSLLCEWIPQRTWIYKKTFAVPEQLKGRRIRLHFEGVDYEAEFFLNGESLGTHTGMFTPAVFEVSDKIDYIGDNLLAVVIEPAPFEQSQVGRTSRVRTGKTRMNYWWDFCPRLVHLGIWEDVYLEVNAHVCINDIWVRPQLSDGFHQADVIVTTELNSAVRTAADLEVSLRYEGNLVFGRRTHHDLEPGHHCLETCLEIRDPHLWWPNGYGEQALYQAEVRVVLPGDDQMEEVSAARSVPFGIRQIEMVANESADPAALPHTFVVNGRKMYAKGWNWVPMDVMYSVPQPAKLERLLTLAKRANVNLLRVWGGGLIEKDSFYNQCDRLGILVWQEFIQSSSGIDNIPSTHSDYIQMVTEVAEQVIPRKRNHPSLAVWCGGNELSSDPAQPKPLGDEHPVLAALKETVQHLDPDRAWLPASPSGPVFMNSLENIDRDPGSLHDVHGPWEYQGVTKQCELYNRGASLLHSEFGVEGLTNLCTLDATISKGHQWPVDLDNPYWFHRGAWWVKRPVWDAAFGELPDVETYVRATQFLQADGLRYALESDRRRKYHNSGTLPWQFNEPYPMAACTSAVDYYARPKPAYYAVARAYAPLLISARFPTLAWDGRGYFEAEAWVCNSHEQSYSDVKVQMRLIGASGRIYAERAQPVSFGGNCAAKLASLQEPLAYIPEWVFFLDLQLLGPRGSLLAHNRYVFSRTADLKSLLVCPSTTLLVLSSRTLKKAEGESEHILWLTNTGETVALSVWLEHASKLHSQGYAYFDDNYFCLLPQETRSVRVTWKDVPVKQRCLEVSAWNIERSLLDLSINLNA